jgi:hypothetical protein
LKKEFVAERTKTNELSITVQALGDRLRDIPLADVMERFGYGRELIRQTHVYRDEEDNIALMVADNKLYDHERQLNTW